MNVDRLVFWMRDLVPTLIEINGILFVDPREEGLAALKAEIAEYDSARDAQQWLNIVLINDFVSEVCGEDWQVTDDAVTELLSLYEKAWSFQIEARFPKARVRIEKWVEADTGDVGLRLIHIEEGET